MDIVPSLVTDAHRLAAVRRLMVDRPPSPVLDRLTRLAAQLVEAPMSLLTLVDSDRQIFLSAYGLPEPFRSQRESGIQFSICQHAVASGRPLIVADAHADAVLRLNAAVIQLGVTAYAGMPLITWDGHAVGTLCVIDMVARDWTDDHLVALSHLADIAMDQIVVEIGDYPDEGIDQWRAVGSRWWSS
jgi:two-component system, LuxR family, sensor kinase FixL